MVVYQNYPNPLMIGTPLAPVVGGSFNPLGDAPTDFVVPAPATRFTYELPDQDVVSIKIYNMDGKFVANASTSASGGQPLRIFRNPAASRTPGGMGTSKMAPSLRVARIFTSSSRSSPVRSRGSWCCFRIKVRTIIHVIRVMGNDGF